MMSKASRLRSIDASPFWEKGLNDDNKLKECERKEIFVAIRKWNMIQSRKRIQCCISPKKKGITIIKHNN